MTPKKQRRRCPNCGQNTLIKNGHTGSGKKQRWLCTGGDSRGRDNQNQRVVCYSTTNPDAPARKQDGKPKVQPRALFFRRALEGAKRVVITCAQNATPVHEPFWKALLGYCKTNNAELIVIPTRYKNPTSRWSASQANAEWWLDPPEVDDDGNIINWGPRQVFLYNQRKKLNENLILLGDIKTQPTAVNPLDGFEAITGKESGILGHTKVALKTVATPQGKLPKILATTGACTVPNYTDSRAGKLGEFHHSLGALVVEIDGPIFHMRQIGATKDGSFYEIARGALVKYSPEGQSGGETAEGLVMGDTHHAVTDKRVHNALFGKGGIVETFRPKKLFWHDLAEGVTINPHSRFNPFVGNAREASGNNDIEAEYRAALAYVLDNTPVATASYIVQSNHNDWLHDWIIETDWRKLRMTCNQAFYLKMASKLHELSGGLSPDEAERLDAFVVYATDYLRNIYTTGNRTVNVLKYDDSVLVAGIECAMHGHLGPNGAKGTLKNLRRIGVKSVTGHEHSPGIDEGAWRVGVNTPLRRGYNPGPSGWLQTQCIIYPNGKRTLINIIEGEWIL